MRGYVMKRNFGFPLLIICIMLIFPVLSLVAECSLFHHPLSGVAAGKWFLFWAVGVRLFTAGLKQSLNPAFTAEKIFNIREKESHSVVRELGFANICIGFAGMISMLFPQWRISSAFTGGLYFGMAGLLHVFKERDSLNEWIAMISDLAVSAVMAAYLVFLLR
jgi:hypothetical protein